MSSLVSSQPLPRVSIGTCDGGGLTAKPKIPFNACEFQSKGDTITDLTEDLAAEQKARTTYDNILRLVKDHDVCDPIRFLREREIVHFQRFGEALRSVQENLDAKNFYAFNPSFDNPCKASCKDCK